ncbi:MAG: M28 family peptidase [Bacillota bacterium]|nr:M28 family peptidase [Bacillota bacterium]
MKKNRLCIIAALVLALVMCLGGCGGGDSESEAPAFSMADDVQKYVEAVDMEYAYDLTETLAYDEEYWDNELGWRTAGSDAEHRCADFLVSEMEKIGLTEVEKVGVTVDKFQFNDSSLTIANTKIDLMPASYQCSGTDADGITAEIVNCGQGLEANYEGKDVTGKIVLVRVDQSNIAWIDSYIRMAHEKGAAAVVSYSTSGYGELNKDTINVQDVCCDDLLPTVAISANQASKIKKAIKNGNNQATLMVDTVLEERGGTSYNVVGKIKGKSSDQQIMIAGHYDKYWYGFQDDSAAIALDFAVAKAMIDSGYTPENDIVVVAHGSEEWGVSNSQFDWTTGAWEMISEAHPEWAGKTLAMLNCELPAIESETLQAAAVPEFRALIAKLVNDTGLVTTAEGVTFEAETTDATNMEDGVSYRWHGVPYFVNGFEGTSFMSERYHTADDDRDTWSEAVMQTNINFYGAFAIYVDKTPALELDMTSTCDDLEANLAPKIAKKAGVDVDAYNAELDKMREAAEGLNAQIAGVNEAYEEAVANDDSEEITRLREQGKLLNQKSLAAFKEVQNQYLKADDVGVYIGHPTLNDNVRTLRGTISALEEKALWTDDEDGACDLIGNLNAYHDWAYYFFSKKVGDDINAQYDANKVSSDLTYWATGKLVPVTYVGDTTYMLYHTESEDDVDFEAAIAAYQSALEEVYADINAYCQQEVAGMQTIAEMMK